MFLCGCILIVCIIGLIVHFANRNSPHFVNLDIATFKGSNYVEDLEVTSSGFHATIKNDVINCKKTEFGRSIGSLQYNISMTFKRWAEQELDRKFYVANKGWELFRLHVSYKGELVTESEWPKVTTKEMRSTKNPIARIDRIENGPPLYGYSDHIVRKKI